MIEYNELEKEAVISTPIIGLNNFTLTHIARSTRLPIRKVKAIIEEAGINLSDRKEEEKAEFLKYSLQDIKSYEELRKLTGIKSNSELMKFCRKHNINYTGNLGPSIDSLIAQGLKLREIGEQCNISHERVRQYIKEEGKYEEWMRKRKEDKEMPKLEEKEKQRCYTLIANYLKERACQLARSEDMPVQNSAKYIFSRKSLGAKPYEFSTLYNVFRIYENAVKTGEKISLEKIARRVNLAAMSISRILSRVGLEPMLKQNNN